MNVSVCFRQISFPFQLPIWVEWMDQLCLPLVRMCVCVCIHTRMLLWVCACACIWGACVHVCRGGGWGEREWVATPHCILLPLWWQWLSPSYSSVFRRSKQPQTPVLQHLSDGVRGQVRKSHCLTIPPTLLWGILVSTLRIWDLFPKGELPAVSRGKRLNIGCLFQKNKHKKINWEVRSLRSPHFYFKTF